MTKEDDNNKNNKKNKDEIKKYEPHLNCNFAMSFMEKYFDGSLSSIIADYVLEHLLTCKECHNKYHEYGMSIGVSFNMREAAIKYATETGKNKKICYTRDTLIRLGFGKDLEVACNQWTVAAEKLDIEKLMNLQSFSEFASDQITIRADYWEEDTNAVYNYTKWFAKKLCKIIDTLEKCLTLEVGDNSQLEGYNNEEKS